MSDTVVPADRPKPKLDDLAADGRPKFANYEEWMDDFNAWHSDRTVRRVEAVLSAQQTTFKPRQVQIPRRDWWIGVAVITAALLFLGYVWMPSRYEWRAASRTDRYLIRIDRWTGEAQFEQVPYVDRSTDGGRRWIWWTTGGLGVPLALWGGWRVMRRRRQAQGS